MAALGFTFRYTWQTAAAVTRRSHARIVLWTRMQARLEKMPEAARIHRQTATNHGNSGPYAP
jgi:hypothetical protein